MNVARDANLLLAFLLEVAVYVLVAWWATGLSSRLPLKALYCLLALVLLVTFWSLFGAESGATWPLHGWARAALDVVWYGLAAAALWAQGRRRWAAGFVLLYAVNVSLIHLWHQ